MHLEIQNMRLKKQYLQPLQATNKCIQYFRCVLENTAGGKEKDLQNNNKQLYFTEYI